MNLAHHQIEIYFSVVQRKVLTPNDFKDLETLNSHLPKVEKKAKSGDKTGIIEFELTKNLITFLEKGHTKTSDGRDIVFWMIRASNGHLMKIVHYFLDQ